MSRVGVALDLTATWKPAGIGNVYIPVLRHGLLLSCAWLVAVPNLAGTGSLSCGVLKRELESNLQLFIEDTAGEDGRGYWRASE